jgi:hypothetical protein
MNYCKGATWFAKNKTTKKKRVRLPKKPTKTKPKRVFLGGKTTVKKHKRWSSPGMTLSLTNMTSKMA